MEIMDTSVDTVSLQIRGSGSLVKSIRPDQVNVRLDLQDAVVGSNAMNIGQENIKLPPGLFFGTGGTPGDRGDIGRAGDP